MKDGELHDKDSLGLTRDVLPGLRIEKPEPPTKDELIEWLEPTEANGALWAVLAATIDNLLSRAYHEMPRGIGLVGVLAGKAADKLASDLGLMTFNTERMRRQFAQFEKAQRDHDLPISVTETEGQVQLPMSLSTWMFVPNPKNVMMTLSALQVASALTCGDWIAVDTGTDDGDYYGENEVSGLLVHYLAHWQRQDREESRSEQPAVDTLHSLRDWAEKIGEKKAPFVFNYAEQALQDLGRESAAARLVRLILKLIEDGYLKRDYGMVLADQMTGPAVVIDSENGCVGVSKQRVVEALTRRNLPVLDTVRATESLREASALRGELGSNRASWVIELDFWETQVGAVYPRSPV